MPKKQSKYKTRKDIFTKKIFPVCEMVRLIKINHLICLAPSKQGRGYWIKKDLNSWESLNNKAILCKVFRDHQAYVDNLESIKNALMN